MSDSESLLGVPTHIPEVVKVFPLIPHIRQSVTKTIDSPLDWKQLTSSEVNYNIVRPLVQRYAKLKNPAVCYACLVVRHYFLSQTQDLALLAIMQSRASFCELLALKLLNHFAHDRIRLVSILTSTWNPLAGAPNDILEDVKMALGGRDDDVNYPQSALEMAISTSAKKFIACPLSQQVVNDMYLGRVVFSVAAHNRSILADNYKPRAIEIYDCRSASVLNHYRLRVPRYAAILEFGNFAVLMVTFVLCLSYQNLDIITPTEIIFWLFAAGFVLKEYTASIEHGWTIYIASLWNAFDAGFIVVLFLYIGFRLAGLIQHSTYYSSLGFDVLACGACILLPRIVFFIVSNHVVILSLRAMIKQFVLFIGIAACCFSGLLFTLWMLGSGTWTFRGIAWLLVRIWFGNTSLSFSEAESFHPVFGPILMTGFAALSNTLLITILICLLSNTVATIGANANEEYLYQFAINTIVGLKSDALFSYQLPFNLLAFIILKPASWVLSPRGLHTLNVFLIRLCSFPILIVIALYERYLAESDWLRNSTSTAQNFLSSLPLVEALVGSGSNDIYEAIFEVDTPETMDLFENVEEELPGSLSHRTSHEGLQHQVESVRPLSSVNTVLRPALGAKSFLKSPIEPPQLRLRAISTAAAEARLRPGPPTPLARLYDRRPYLELHAPTSPGQTSENKEANLGEQLKEIQARQSRIEEMLMKLTNPHKV